MERGQIWRRIVGSAQACSVEPMGKIFSLARPDQKFGMHYDGLEGPFITRMDRSPTSLALQPLCRNSGQ